MHRTLIVSSLAAALLVGCRSDCVTLPCSLPEAVTVNVSAPGSQSPPSGLAITGTSGIISGSCDTSGICHVLGSAGTYHLTVSATGFAPKSIDVTVTGTAPSGCSCGKVNRQQVDLVLQPAP